MSTRLNPVCNRCGGTLPSKAVKCEYCGLYLSTSSLPSMGKRLKLPKKTLPATLVVLSLTLVLVLWLNLRGGQGADSDQARQALKNVVTAQQVFVDLDKDGDGKRNLGTLKDLGRARLIHAHIANGNAFGYRFELLISESAPGKQWMAVANPESALARSFVTNHEGVVYFYSKPISLDPSCLIPSDCVPATAGP